MVAAVFGHVLRETVEALSAAWRRANPMGRNEAVPGYSGTSWT